MLMMLRDSSPFHVNGVQDTMFKQIRKISMQITSKYIKTISYRCLDNPF